jgi:hypothetical protein
MGWESRVPHANDLRVLFEKTRDFERLRGMPLHAQRQGSEPPERQEAAERVEYPGGRVMHKTQPV